MCPNTDTVSESPGSALARVVHEVAYGGTCEPMYKPGHARTVLGTGSKSGPAPE